MHLIGIMKSNYTMLDNLQLGIKPTKEGMEEVIKKVNAWNKANGRATKYQISNLADCQSALVDYIEMQGLAGYAANEAADTIQGSWASLKASWQNLLVGFSDGNQDVKELIKNTVNSAGKVISNIMPRVKQVLKNIKGLLPDWAQNLIASLEQVLNYAKEKFSPVLEDLKNAFNTIKDALEPVINTIKNYVTNGEMANNITSILKSTIDVILIAYTNLKNIVFGVVDGFREIVKWGKEHETAVTLLGVAIGTLTAAIIAYNAVQAIKNAGGIIEIAQLAATAIGVGALTAAETAHTIAAGIATVATTAFGAAVAFLTSPVTLVILAIGALIAIGVLLYKNWDKIKAKAIEVFTKIKDFVRWKNR